MTVQLYIVDDESSHPRLVTKDTFVYESTPPLPGPGEIVYAGDQGHGWKVKRRTFQYQEPDPETGLHDVEVRLFVEHFSS